MPRYTHFFQPAPGLNVLSVFGRILIFRDQEDSQIEAAWLYFAGKSRIDHSLVLRPQQLDGIVPKVQQTSDSSRPAFQ